MTTQDDHVYIAQYASFNSATNWYKNLRFLGRGGNGTAFLIQCTSGPLKGGIFALKVFHKVSSPQRLERFLNEIAFLRTSNHPHWMRHLDEGEYYQRPYVIQDYMPLTLAAELAKGRMDFGRAIVFSCQLVSALAALHAQGIMHRDIKPQNIFIEGMSSYLGDFGLIKKIDEPTELDEINDFNGYFACLAFIAPQSLFVTPEMRAA